MGRILSVILSSLGILMLIINPKTALSGAAMGIDLCIRSVIPSLFPFFVLSMMLTSALQGVKLPLLRPVGKLCRIPQGGEGLLIVSFLGGYPVGAQAVSGLYQDGQISKESARRLLTFCSNAGPAFIFGIVAGQFENPGAGFALWANHILSALIVGAFFPGNGEETVQIPRSKTVNLPQCVSSSIRVISSVCGWVILFRIIMAFLWDWFPGTFPNSIQTTINGILELTGGCCNLAAIPNVTLRFTVASALLSFGGLCVLMQTASVCGELGIGYYLKGKLMQCAVSILLAQFSAILGVILLITAAFCRELKNRSRNPKEIIV